MTGTHNGSAWHLLLLDAVVHAAGRRLVGPKQTDGAGLVGVQHVPRLVSHHQVQSQDPERRGETETERRPQTSERKENNDALA